MRDGATTNLAAVLQTALALVLAPLLTAGSTLAARRWGPRVGGVVSAFPAIVGPVLLILAIAHGPEFAARAAGGTLFGLVALSAFAVAYGRVASARPGWRTSLAAGWVAAALASAAVGAGAGRANPAVGLAVAVVSLASAHRALPRATPDPAVVERSTGIPARMALTAALVLTLSAVAGAAGPVIGGMLAALPVLASILAVLSHREAGPGATIALLRGMLAGMAGFVVFCAAVALLVTRAALPAFLAATAAAVAVQAWVAARRVAPGG
jgi:hypothetical protein